MKAIIKNTFGYHPNSVLRITEQLLRHLPHRNIVMETYKKKDFKKFSLMIPKPLENLTIKSKGFGISKVNEILLSATDDFKLQWKMLSSELEYTDAKIRIREVHTFIHRTILLTQNETIK